MKTIRFEVTNFSADFPDFFLVEATDIPFPRNSHVFPRTLVRERIVRDTDVSVAIAGTILLTGSATFPTSESQNHSRRWRDNREYLRLFARSFEGGSAVLRLTKSRGVECKKPRRYANGRARIYGATKRAFLDARRCIHDVVSLPGYPASPRLPRGDINAVVRNRALPSLNSI